MRVLIADARPSVRATLRALLEHDPRCREILEAENALDTLAAVRRGPELLLLNWGLPGLAPAVLVKQARNICPGLVIVALGQSTHTRQAAFEAGVHCYVDTSQPPADFMALLHSLCPGVGEALTAA